jgi:uncharacterized protein (DUF342 family)
MADTNDITVRVLDDGRRAEVRIPAGADKATLTPALLRVIASEAGVQITAAVERRLTEAAMQFKAGATELVTDISHAVEPVNGCAGGWVWEPRFDPTAKVASAGTEGRSTDHYSSHILNVTAGITVARIKPPTDGTDGRSVTGAVIAARPGPSATVRAGQGLTQRADGLVVAACDGVLSVSRGVASVLSVLEIKACVDFSTGHVDFKGDVVVGDAVRDGFNVSATGNVTVHGPVEGATIVCAGDLICPRGIASARRSEITVEGDADIAFVRNATAVFRNDLTCRGEIEHSDVTVGGALMCESGRVIGGSLALTAAAKIGTIGSPDWAPTTVRLGDLPLVAMELKRLTVEAARMQKLIATKEENMRTLMAYSGGKSASSREELTIIQYELSELQRSFTEGEARRAQLQRAMREGRKAGVHVARTVYPRVRIQHGEAAFVFEQELKGPLQFLLNEGGAIQVRVSTLDPRPISDFAHAVRVPATDQIVPAAHLRKSA